MSLDKKAETMYVDVHCHLTYDSLYSQLGELMPKCEAAGFEGVVVNGLEPETNRKILAMAADYDLVKPALGIYPLNAAAEHCGELPFPVAAFDLDAEIAFIRELAIAGKLAAIGECGLDGYWLKEPSFAAQEKVFEQLVAIAVEAGIPVIIHSRKLEQRAFDIVAGFQYDKVVFHCYGGKVKLAARMLEQHDWCFSIPATSRRNEAFRKMLASFPLRSLLTETDSPYLPPVKGELNTPLAVVATVAHLASLRDMTVEEAQQVVMANYRRLFQPATIRTMKKH